MSESIHIDKGIVVIMNDKNIIIDHKTYPKPSKGNNMTTIDGKVYVNGFRFKKGKFKRSIVAVFHNYIIF